MKRTEKGLLMTRHALKALQAALMLLVFSIGCSGTPSAFATRYPDNVESDFASVVTRAQAGARRTTPPIAAGVTAAGHLYGYDLAAKRVLWEVPARPRFSPLLAGNSIVIQEGGRVVGLDVKTGAQRFQFDAGDMHLVGADGVDERTVIALTSGQGTYARSQVVLMDGVQRLWNHALPHPVGVPALTGEVVLVPWSNQYLSGLDAATGDELSRLRVRDGVISHAFVSAGQVYVGSEHGIALLSHQLLAGDLNSGAHYLPPDRELPGQPAFLYDAYASKPLPPPESAHSRVQLTWETASGPSNAITLTSNNVYLIFYRFVLALDQRDYTLRWAHTHDVDVIGGRAQHDGIVLADAKGAVTYLGAETGGALWREQNAPVSVDLEFPANQNAIGAARNAAVSTLNLREQLATAARDPDSRLVPVRLLAVQLLSELPDAAATGDLVSLCEEDRTTLAVRKSACKLLRGRTVGGEHVLRALQRHASFLAATTAPPVGALAKAASAQKELRAAPLLIAHLKDPNTPSEGLPDLVQALGELGDPEAIEPLRVFLRLYHADPIDEHIAKALALVPAALLRLQGPEVKPLLTAINEDGLTTDGVRDAASKVLSGLDAGAAGQAAQATADAAQPAAGDAEGEQAKAQAPQEPQPPAHITVDIIKKTLLPVHDPLQGCIRNAQPEAFQARVVLVVEDGQVLMVSVLPEHLQSCIEPLVRSQPFPLTHLSQRDRVTYVIKRY
jgi:outer membrane protein assembly factor BamB